MIGRKRVIFTLTLIFFVLFITLYFRHALPPRLYASGSELKTSLGQKVVLEGVTTDYFRHGPNKYFTDNLINIEARGLTGELNRLELLKSAYPNLNFVVLYLAHPETIKERTKELDAFIDYLSEEGFYALLAPVARNFDETSSAKSRSKDLTEFTEFLASRYGREPHLFFQPAAEPELPTSVWRRKQEDLVKLIRKHSNNLIFLSTPYYSAYDNASLLNNYKNIAYSTGGYVSKDDQAKTEYTIDEIVGGKAPQDKPVIVIEFGGNYGGQFSSARDLSLFKEIVEKISEKGIGYSIYRLSSSEKNDGLALFDENNELTNKGGVFLEAIK